MRVAVVLLIVVAGVALTTPGRLPRAIGWSGPRPRRRQPRPRRKQRVEVARVLVEVAARLRAGGSMTQAWQHALPEPPPVWAGPVLSALDGGAAGAVSAPSRVVRTRDGPRPRAWLQRRRTGRDRAGADVAAAVAACRLSARTGAPLAEVIDVVVAGVAEARTAEGLRRAALAGPRATARLLTWLPVGGVVLGTVLGADPMAVLLGGGAGGFCLVGGAALSFAGHRWVRALIEQAERSGQ